MAARSDSGGGWNCLNRQREHCFDIFHNQQNTPSISPLGRFSPYPTYANALPQPSRQPSFPISSGIRNTECTLRFSTGGISI